MKGTVIKSTGSWYEVLVDDKTTLLCRMKGIFRIKGLKATNPIAVGDRVLITFVEDEDTKEKHDGVITEVLERKNYLIRKSKNLSKQIHIIAANVDCAYLLVTLASPKTSLGFIDRFLATCEAYSIKANLIFNKKDIYDAADMQEVERIRQLYKRIGYDSHFISAHNKSDVSDLKAVLRDKVNLFTGHSGVGKSTLINTLQPELELKTAEISGTHLKGMHTTTFAEMHPLKFGGFIIDTPGIKELSIVEMEKHEISHYYPEIFKLSSKCKYGSCLHINEPECAVIQAVENGVIAESRYASYLSIISGEETVKEYND